MIGISARRRAMMGGAEAAPVPSIPYITNGLIMFLDGFDVASNGLWVDKIGGAQFTLHNATKAAGGGVTFTGNTNSYGESPVTFPDGVTIEAAYSLNNASANAGIFAQKWPDVGNNDKPVIVLLRVASTNCIYVKFGTANKACRRSPLASVEIVSAVRWVSDSRAVKNGVNITDTTSSYASYPSGGVTGSLLGTRGGGMNMLNGTLHCLRIYDRALTVAEMQANQAVDDERFNLGVIA